MELLFTRVVLGRAGSQRDLHLGNLLQRDWERGDISWHLRMHLASNPGSKMGQSHGPHVSPRSWSSSTQRSKRLCRTPQPKLSSWDVHRSQHLWLLTLHTATSASCSWKTGLKKVSSEYQSRSLKKEIILWSISTCFHIVKEKGQRLHSLNTFVCSEITYLVLTGSDSFNVPSWNNSGNSTSSTQTWPPLLPDKLVPQFVLMYNKYPELKSLVFVSRGVRSLSALTPGLKQHHLLLSLMISWSLRP